MKHQQDTPATEGKKMTYSPKTSAQSVVGGWKDFDRAPSKQEIYRRQLAADGIVEPKMVVTDLALEEIPNGAVVRAIFAGRKESYQKVDGQWEETSFRKVWDSAWIVRNVLQDPRAGGWVLEIPVSEWHNFQK